MISNFVDHLARIKPPGRITIDYQDSRCLALRFNTSHDYSDDEFLERVLIPFMIAHRCTCNGVTPDFEGGVIIRDSKSEYKLTVTSVRHGHTTELNITIVKLKFSK